MSEYYQKLATFIRQNRGAPISIFTLLLLSQRSLNNQQLQTATGYSYKTIQNALLQLEQQGILLNHGRQHGWTLNYQKPLLQTNFAKQLIANPSQPADKPRAHAGTSTRQPQHNQAHNEAREVGNSNLEPHKQGQEVGNYGRNKPKSPKTAVNSTLSQSQLKPTAVNSTLAQPQNAAAAVRDPNQDLLDQQQQQTTTTTTLLEQIGIRGRALKELSQQSPPPHLLLAWQLYTLTQPWLRNPAGYIISQLRQQNPPPQPFQELALHCLHWTHVQLETLIIATTGNQAGRLIHPPAKDPQQLRHYLQQELPHMGPNEMHAYLQLIQQGWSPLQNHEQ